MIKAWHGRGWEEYLFWQQQDKKTLKKINTLINDMPRNSYKCIGKPEPLKHQLSGWWSAKIDEKNRLIFRLSGTHDNETIEILACKGHYDEHS